MKFEFSPPSSLTAGKVKLTIPSEVLAWADEIAATNESTREAVLGQAIRCFESQGGHHAFPGCHRISCLLPV